LQAGVDARGRQSCRLGEPIPTAMDTAHHRQASLSRAATRARGESPAAGGPCVAFWRKRDSDFPELWPLSANPSMFGGDGGGPNVVAQPLSDNVSTLRGDGR
jgi:hypothetical protein